MPDFSTFRLILEGLLTGLSVTVIVALAALVIGLVLGFGLCLLREFTRIRTVHFTIDAYVELLRNIPALTHLFILYFGLASLGLRLSSITAAIVGLGLIGAAVTCDIFRAGFRSLPKGQIEAALAVGLRPGQTIVSILTPQAMRIALPGLSNYAVQLVKDTSVVSAIAAPEIMFFARSMVTSSFQTTLIYATAAGLYLLLSLPLMQGVRVLENHYGKLKA
ncbi:MULTISPECIES: amino acid ABC transporter permease [unclassified Rhizobium]|uniref:amino acid ABC transporter permease n=1 Tax=unclassified Rhizobium TaxID=2613769 RepID=UPI000715AA02|nr:MULTISPECIES: amino acid ABC transporter permease [unclassified Rhizobium]KQS82358.1 ABC transporter permease [Rhizobium sp. Leaf386]KQT02705.1 ABC transporter permease [Rhizobium sp. Leaf391]KQU03424.1 ABC transporter permease [Rhizobium sp. Leaf453]